ncbi:MAG TPA: molybdate ABC transporter substrate-binding protein [Gemmatimonadales bacterium]|nr:molybdate ABC transporter substrate-binding protein [Gemmatimonadales bacterium]
MNAWFRLVLALTGASAAVRPSAGPVAKPAPADPPPATVTVFAAASLTESFRELGSSFERRHPGVAVQFSFAGSQQLALQMEQGAPADVFASADQRWMDYAKDKGLVEGETPVFTRNRLVIIVPKTNPARIGKLEDLARRGTKVVLAAEQVPVGNYSREALKKLAAAPGFPAHYDRRVAANVVSQEENVKSVVSKVQLGEADAGIVYRSDVTPAAARYVRELQIPDAFNIIAEYPIAVAKSARDAESARQFVALVRSSEGQRVLQAHGFVPVTAIEAASHP